VWLKRSDTATGLSFSRPEKIMALRGNGFRGSSTDKAKTSLAVTLSLGERPDKDLEAWREAGADRYLLRFETSDSFLYHLFHPSLPGRESNRFAILRRLKEIGYQIGSEVMIGLPGQTYESLAEDIQIFRELDLDMVGVGPYITHPATPVGSGEWDFFIPCKEQVLNTDEMTYKVTALTQIVCPEANIPSTTALATLNRKSGRELGQVRGTNVVMPNLTPLPYRTNYEIYPSKVCFLEKPSDLHIQLSDQILSIGRRIGEGRGDRIRK
jgi:biotin synthase